MKKVLALITWAPIFLSFISAVLWLLAALDNNATNAIDVIAPGNGNFNLAPSYFRQLSVALKNQANLNKYAAYAAAAAVFFQGFILLLQKFTKTSNL